MIYVRVVYICIYCKEMHIHMHMHMCIFNKYLLVNRFQNKCVSVYNILAYTE